MVERPVVTSLKPEPNVGYVVKVELDERSFLFPSGKSVIQLVFRTDGRVIHVEVVFPYNQSHTPARIVTLNFDDAKELGRRLVEAVHQARTQLVVSDSARIAINIMVNGYHIQIGDMNESTDLYLGISCIWRVCQGLLRVVDHIAPIESN